MYVLLINSHCGGMNTFPFKSKGPTFDWLSMENWLLYYCSTQKNIEREREKYKKIDEIITNLKPS